MSKSPPTARATAAEQTRTRLIDAAIDRFAADGPGASFDQVAADAGVTKGALYHHFGSKDGLVEAVYREAIRRHAARVVDASGTGSGRERLLALIDSSARLYTSRTPFYGLLTQLHLHAGTSRPELADIARRVQQRQREHMIGLAELGRRDGSIRADLDAEALGLTVNAALEGFLVQQLEPAAVQRGWITAFRSLIQEMITP
ncbi:MAG: putative regulator [Solirubrobacterales bacterium]|nr:putative regulator [Solirubrobacterales bacterium]